MSRDYPGELAELIRRSRHLTVLTGAGISTESGIPDFRSPGGVWSKQSPVMFQDFLDDAARRRVDQIAMAALLRLLVGDLPREHV